MVGFAPPSNPKILIMSKEGSIDAPIRHPINFEHPDFLDPKKLDDEMRRLLISVMDVEDVLIYVTRFQNYLT